MKYIARAVLLLLASAALFGLYVAPVTPAHTIWPLHRHTRVLLLVLVDASWFAAALAALAALVWFVVTLVRWAEV